MAATWTARYDFHWQPILTFARRRESLAAWLEANADIKAVLRSDEDLGVGIGHRSVKLTVSRNGLHLTVGTPSADLAGVWSSVCAVFEHMEPRGFHMAGAGLSQTCELPNDYQQYRRRLTARAVSNAGSDAELVDCAVRADLRAPSADLQLEFGVVDELELMDRLTEPRKSGPPVPKATDVGELPSVSLFGLVTWIATSRLPRPEVDAPDALCEYVRTVIEKVNQESGSVIDALGQGLIEEGDQDEFTRGA